MAWTNPSDDAIRSILTGTRSVALVGASADVTRPSNNVLRWLVARGYDVTPVNPGLGGRLSGRPVMPRLADLPGPVDMIDVFRNSAAVEALVDDVLALPWRPNVLWLQLGVVNVAAGERAAAAGMVVVMDRCPVIEAARLGV